MGVIQQGNFMIKICIHAKISGRVQGVFFRDSTQKKAKNLQLTGWVKNLASGEVELIACGDPENIKQFKTWLQHGPPLAKVKNLECEEIPIQEFSEFKMLR